MEGWHLRNSRMAQMRPVVAGVATMGALILTAVSGSADASLRQVVNGKHLLSSTGAPTNVSPNNLIYHGGLVETTPAVSGSAGGSLPHVVNGKHILWSMGASTNVSPNNLIYHGGLVETTPAVYNVFWGAAW